MQLIIDRPEISYVEFSYLEIGDPYWCEELACILVTFTNGTILLISDNDADSFCILEGEPELIDYCNQYDINPKILTFTKATNAYMSFRLLVE